MKREIKLKNELNKRDMERIIQFLYSLNEIEEVTVDMDENKLIIDTKLSETHLKNLFKTSLNIEIME